MNKKIKGLRVALLGASLIILSGGWSLNALHNLTASEVAAEDVKNGGYKKAPVFNIVCIDNVKYMSGESFLSPKFGTDGRIEICTAN